MHKYKIGARDALNSAKLDAGVVDADTERVGAPDGNEAWGQEAGEAATPRRLRTATAAAAATSCATTGATANRRRAAAHQFQQ